MIWKIADTPDNATILNLAFSIEPSDPVLYSVMMGVYPHLFPKLADQLARNTSYGQEFLYVKLYSEMDEEDRPLAIARGMKEDEVELFHEVFGRSFMNERLFYLFVYDYASRMLGKYHHHAEVQKNYTRWLHGQTAPDYYNRHYFLHYNNNWALALEEGLQQLKQNITIRYGY
jgi:hypothetical protein